MERDSISALYENSMGGLFVTIACALALVFGFPDPDLNGPKYLWGVIFLCLMLFRLLDTLYWHRNLRHTNFQTSGPKSRFVVSVLITSILWMTYALVLIQSVDLLELTTLIIVLSSLAGGGATVLSGNMMLSVTYSVLMIAPLSVMMVLSDDRNQNILGVLGLFFAVVLALGSIRAANFTRNAIMLKNQNADLVESMEEKNKEISEANSALESKVQDRTREIFALSNIDPLTGLFNRTAFSTSLSKILANCEAQGGSFALLFIDLDGFKAINDTQGHGVGDKVLFAIAQRLILFSKGPDHICRWGGDEFIIVIEDIDSDGAILFGRDLIKSLSQSIQIDLNKLTVGATIGVAMYPEHGNDESELISLADTAMYIQKEEEKSDVRVFSVDMRKSQLREQQLKEGLALALQNHEFHLVYQSVIDNQTNEVSFCEVLLRWELNGELVPPHEFIPIAEQYGLIHEIGEWVLMTACAESKNWCFGDKVDISVNVSVPQLLRNDFIGIVREALFSSGFPATRLHLEITESVFANNTEVMFARIKELRSLGIKVSVDDFGTGFSSLSQLQKMSADIVKIDRSFIASMNEGGQAIIQATQYMAKQLGYSVVAEGVETKQQADELSDIGIGCSQGYYFSYPMTIDKLAQWHQDYKQGKRNDLT
ncbi:hypothetical protein PHACT_07365 [Pseudohongiella acticola]|uniref:Diguanylate cyclase n=1 Tax=Pseudohongiella acticola TaxID=1524254 RepID=A0A1E8CP23_9GAMM|nr:hypothetical protein PHACT_07365 [Pseudohongiella acticola]